MLLNILKSNSLKKKVEAVNPLKKKKKKTGTGNTNQ